MDTLQIILIALMPIILTPLVFGFRHKLGLGKRKIKIVAACPHCGADIGLEKLRNYICGNCNAAVAFFDLETGEPHPEARFFSCEKCGYEDYKGLKTCRKCGHPVSPSA